MEISDVSLAAIGIDPSLYSKEEKKQIGDDVDRLLQGNPKSLLASVDPAVPKEHVLREKAQKSHDWMFEALRALEHSMADFARQPELGNLSVRPLSEKQISALLDRVSGLLQQAEATAERVTAATSAVSSCILELAEIGNEYNLRLARLGRLRIACALATAHTGKVCDDAGLDSVTADVYDHLLDLTNCIEALKDCNAICSSAIHEKIPQYLDRMAEALDVPHEGHRFRQKETAEAAGAICRILRDILNS